MQLIRIIRIHILKGYTFKEAEDYVNGLSHLFVILTDHLIQSTVKIAKVHHTYFSINNKTAFLSKVKRCRLIVEFQKYE